MHLRNKPLLQTSKNRSALLDPSGVNGESGSFSRGKNTRTGRRFSWYSVLSHVHGDGKVLLLLGDALAAIHEASAFQTAKTKLCAKLIQKLFCTAASKVIDMAYDDTFQLTTTEATWRCL